MTRTLEFQNLHEKVFPKLLRFQLNFQKFDESKNLLGPQTSGLKDLTLRLIRIFRF